MPRRSHLFASPWRRRVFMRLLLGWLLVLAPGLAVVVFAAEVFRLMAS